MNDVGHNAGTCDEVHQHNGSTYAQAYVGISHFENGHSWLVFICETHPVINGPWPYQPQPVQHAINASNHNPTDGHGKQLCVWCPTVWWAGWFVLGTVWPASCWQHCCCCDCVQWFCPCIEYTCHVTCNPLISAHACICHLWTQFNVCLMIMTHEYEAGCIMQSSILCIAHVHEPDVVLCHIMGWLDFGWSTQICNDVMQFNGRHRCRWCCTICHPQQPFDQFVEHACTKVTMALII